MPTLYIIAGCNGSGKTTTANTLLPGYLNCNEFVNADILAAGMRQFYPGSVEIFAGKTMLTIVRGLISEKLDFTVETTLSGRIYQGIIEECHRAGYQVTMLFVWLRSADLAVQRVKKRVGQGGHHIPEDDIRRRYERGIVNFFDVYTKRCDSWMLADNSDLESVIVAEGNNNVDFEVFNGEIWNQIMYDYDVHKRRSKRTT